MLKIGITGGIGSGKTIVSRIFETLNIPVFNADNAAKFLMENNSDLKADLIAAFGIDIYNNGRLNRPLLASIVFKNKEKLDLLNSIVHPAVIQFGNEWHLAQNATYTLKEAALFFESGSYKEMDFIIGVTAPKELRIKRSMNRDGATREQILERISKQMDDAEKMAKCKYVIVNDDQLSVIHQVNQIHHTILELI